MRPDRTKAATHHSRSISARSQNGRRLSIVVRAEDDPPTFASRAENRTGSSSRIRSGIRARQASGRQCGSKACPSTWIDRIRWTPNLERWEIGFEAWLGGTRREGLKLGVKLRVGDTLLADDTYTVVAGEVHRRIALSDPGIDDYRNGLLWNPGHADADRRAAAALGRPRRAARRSLELHGTAIDRVDSDRFVLNGRPYLLRMVLDQGYWPETGLTAPDDDALRRDVELAKAMGFNGVRKHQKIEDPRYLYWADKLGLLVWEEMPSAYRFTDRSVQRVSREWIAAIERDNSHPCIIAWVPINESWGVPNLPTSPAERHYVQGAVSPDEDARSHAARDRQRRLGERRDRHHRHPRLRQRSRADRQAIPRRRSAAAAVQARAAGRPAAGSRRRQRTRPADHADRVRRDRVVSRRPRLGLLARRSRKASSRQVHRTARVS